MGQPWGSCGAATSCLVRHRVGGWGDRDKHRLREHVWGKKPMGGTSLGQGDTANVSEVRAPPFRCYNLYLYIYMSIYIYVSIYTGTRTATRARPSPTAWPRPAPAPLPLAAANKLLPIKSAYKKTSRAWSGSPRPAPPRPRRPVPMPVGVPAASLAVTILTAACNERRGAVSGSRGSRGTPIPSEG